jgi:FlaA1/EpsC-like NDP-sugar epimerase
MALATPGGRSPGDRSTGATRPAPQRARWLRDNALARRGTLALWDALCWTAATAVVLGVRLDFAVSDIQWRSTLRYLVISTLVLVAFGYLTKFYRGRFRVGSFDEVTGLAGQFAIVGMATALFFTVFDPVLPRSIPVLVPPIALISAAAGRWLFRTYRDRNAPGDHGSGKRALVYGAGDAGYQLVTLLRAERNPEYRVVGLIDDNPAKRHLRLHGIPVVGDRSTLGEAANELDADTVILAITSASGELVGALQDEIDHAGLELLTLPPISEMIGGRIELGSIRQVDITDVLGRHPIDTDLGDIADYLSGRRVLITGAGGSIGAELARQVHRFGPSKLVLLDRDESALHAVQLSIQGHGLLDGEDTVLNDIRDYEALDLVFARHRPEIVFHAAALKHLPLLERFPDEGWKTNVEGTRNVLEAAHQHGVEHLVNISTDKAAAATSVLGATKRLAEQITAWYAADTGRRYISVRFGNVLGSRGSMLETFNTQIERGGPITVTHPEVTRYFMTIPEACELVIQAGAIGLPGEVLVLDMGTPVKILDVARRMIATSGKRIDITFTGLREGEKLHEVLFSDHEDPAPTKHPMVRSVAVPAVDPSSLAELRSRRG